MTGLRRRRAASVAGYARVSKADPDELADMRAKGGAVRGAQLRGNSSWGQRMAAAKRLRRYGPGPSAADRLREIEARLSALELKEEARTVLADAGGQAPHERTISYGDSNSRF